MKNLLKIIYRIALIFTLAFLFIRCGTIPKPPDVVCEYGTTICDFTDQLCTNYSEQLPPEFCYYTQLACINLNFLCDTTLSQEQREIYLESQKQINQKIQTLMKAKK